MAKKLKFLPALFLVIPLFAHALEVDDKLTLRILKTSDSKKTVLINRGIEDGLTEGDHAKFFTTSGVVARGMLVKLSPTRSIWSMYRLVNPDSIQNDWVMNLKITEPVKVVEDATKMLVREPVVTDTDPTGGIPLAEGARDLPTDLTASQQQDLTQLLAKPTPENFTDENWEFFLLANLASLSGEATSNLATSEESTTGTTSTLDGTLGLELYGKDINAWYGNFSLQAYMRWENREILTGDGQTMASNINEYGAGVNWYPFSKKSHNSLKIFIPYINVGMGIGDIVDNYSFYTQATQEITGELSGSTSFWQLAGGMKYYLPSGIGFKGEFAYLSRSIAYEVDENDEEWTKEMGGIKLGLGLSYRF